MDGWSECHSNKISAENVDLGFAILFLAAIFDFLHVAMFSASFVRCIPLFFDQRFPAILEMRHLQYDADDDDDAILSNDD